MILKMSSPLISIIVPVYKVQNFLCRCIDSILKQTFTDFECILVDDGSPDSCPDICDRYAGMDNRIKVIHQQNLGVSTARNTGLNFASGIYIGFVDSDDIIDPEMFSLMYHNAVKSNADLVMCGLLKENRDNKISVFAFEEKFFTKEEFLSFFSLSIRKIENTLIINSVWNKLYKKTLLNNIYFDHNFRLGEDCLFNLEVFERCNYIYVSSSTPYIYCYNCTSATKLITKESLENSFLLIKKISDFLLESKSTKINIKSINLYTRNIIYNMICLIILDKCNANKYVLLKNIRSCLACKTLFTQVWQFKYFIILLMCKIHLFKFLVLLGNVMNFMKIR